MGGNVGDKAGRPSSHYLLYPALLCLGLFVCLSEFNVQEIMYRLSSRVYPASHEDRPTKDTGTYEEHASQHRPTTHPPLGLPLQY